MRGYHPLIAAVAGTGDVLHARLRGGNAASGRGAASFLRETFTRTRAGGASGPLTLRADSGFYSKAVVAACRGVGVRFSITARLHPTLRNRIEAISRGGLDAHSLLAGGRGGRRGDALSPLRAATGGTPARPPRAPAPGTQLALLTEYSYHPFITDREGELLELEADHRRHAEVENVVRDLKYGVGLNHLPSGRFAANAAWLALNVIAHNLARWVVRLGLNESSPPSRSYARSRRLPRSEPPPLAPLRDHRRVAACPRQSPCASDRRHRRSIRRQDAGRHRHQARDQPDSRPAVPGHPPVLGSEADPAG